MTDMTDTEARTIIWDMFKTALSDVASFNRRLAELGEEYKADPHPLTERQIERIKARLEKRIKESAALAVVATKAKF